ncbi:MAG: glycosyltransferase [Deltaproteobacteria bacterium]|nr:glycosyltransferase [Deltaproteobacteria bacterium]
MKYSIIIPTLNEEKVLPELLKQLSDKELKLKYNYEVIVSDGGSTDDTILIANKYASKIVIHNKEKKQNISEGRNAGANIANSDILIFINGDVLFDNLEYFFARIQNKFIDSEYFAMTCKVSVIPS